MLKKGLREINILEKALDAAWLRNRVISNNIANVDTPNYKAYRVEFEEILKNAVENREIEGYRTHRNHFQIGNFQPEQVQPRIEKNNKTSLREDGNNVDIDTEMANLAKNTVMYQALVEQLMSKLSRIKTAINEGRR